MSLKAFFVWCARKPWDRNQFWFFGGKILGNWDGKFWASLINDYRSTTWLSFKFKPSLLSFTQFSCEKNLIWLYYVLFYPHTMSLNKLFAIETLYFWHVNWFYLSGFRFWLSPHILTYIIHLISRDDWVVGGLCGEKQKWKSGEVFFGYLWIWTGY